MNSVHHIAASGMLRPSSYPGVIYELKPNLNTYFKMAKFKTNQHGLRDKEYGLYKPNKCFRIGVIGDSFTMGSGIDISEVFHSVIEEKLNNDSQTISFECLNFGVGGYNLRQYLEVLENKAQNFNLDLVIIGFCPNNDHQITPDDISGLEQKTNPVFKSFFFEMLKEELEKIIEHYRKLELSTEEKTEKISQKQKKYMLGIFSKMSAFSKNQNIPIVIANISTNYNAKTSNDIKNIVIEAGLYFVDLSLYFKDTNIETYKIYKTDMHPNRKANKIFADNLYNYLIQNKFVKK